MTFHLISLIDLALGPCIILSSQNSVPALPTMQFYSSVWTFGWILSAAANVASNLQARAEMSSRLPRSDKLTSSSLVFKIVVFRQKPTLIQVTWLEAVYQTAHSSLCSHKRLYPNQKAVVLPKTCKQPFDESNRPRFLLTAIHVALRWEKRTSCPLCNTITHISFFVLFVETI